MVFEFVGFDAFAQAFEVAFVQRAAVVVAQFAAAVVAHFMGERDVGLPVFDGLLADRQLQDEEQAFVAGVRGVEGFREGGRSADVEQGAEDFLPAGGEEFVGAVGRVLQAEVLYEAGDGFAAEGATLRRHNGEGDEVFRRFAARLGRFGRFAATEEAGV